MKKLGLIAVLAFLTMSRVYAGSVELGIRGGINFSSIPAYKDFQLIDHELVVLPDSYTGFHFGLFGRLSAGNMFIMPEILYSETGQKMTVRTNMGGEPVREFTQLYSHLKIPFTIGTNLGPFYVGIGPVANFLLDNTRKHVENFSFEYSDTTMSYQVMAGLKIGNLIIDFRFEDNLTNFGTGIQIGDEFFDFDSRPRHYIIGIGIALF